jgi:phospholipase/lecithinase/hemolysin
MRAIRLLFVFLAMALSAQIARAYSGIDFFGDSLTDVGNVWTATKLFDPDHVKPLCPPYWNGRFCNGPNYADQLSAHFGLPAPTPSLLGGNDYAWGGAGTATSGFSTLQTPNLGTQVTAYLDNLNGSPIDPNRLVVVWAGGNDPIYEGQTNYAQSVANIMDAVSRLVNQAGAKNILVNNLPALGNTPAVIAQGQEVRDALNGWTLGFDYALDLSLTALRSTLPSDVTLLDSLPGQEKIDVLFSNVIADPAAFGITNVTDQAYQTTDSGLPGPLVPNSEYYLFWDFVHPTTYAVGMLVPEPSTLVLLILSATGLLVAVLRHRRSKR